MHFYEQDDTNSGEHQEETGENRIRSMKRSFHVACLMLVYTGYKPKTFYLEKLDRQACQLDYRFKTIFPRKSTEEERLFQLLKKAYIDSRYTLDYKVAKEDLEYLSERVKKLRELTGLACREKIESF